MAKVIDLDSQIDFGEDAPLHTQKVKLLGREWTIVCDVNVWNMSTIASSIDGLSRLLLGVIAEDERDAFTAALGAVKSLNTEKLVRIVNALIEVAAERPTKRPSVSTRGAVKRTSARKSAASSSRRVAASKR